ncbi:acyl-CoA dehydrogenase [Pseudoalteromonas fenneropenaei]|uniref:Acyl-coenzyme A dehydrogenase n=1 Tax=Pseudoalteromonas fenneropenaei TaxID=1737459 RepID=A0ABV7CGC7_9GAMM
MSWLILIVAAVVIIFAVKDIRYSLVSKPIMRFFKRALPPLSQTEQEAMEAGDVWWDAALFSGRPDWGKLHRYPKPALSDEERAFIDNELETLLAMIDEEQVARDKDLSPEVWQYLKSQGFFAFIIPKRFGGRQFSAQANSHIVARIASKSLSAAVTVMVPNSLGPAELLLHYGTPEQQEYWLPKLAIGEALPCFALTGPEAGSDAGSIPDTGIICQAEIDGKMQLALKLTWSKRYITLAPVATVLGLAFKAFDPERLLGGEEALGITCALIPTDHPGVKIGARHNPLNLGFLNGTTEGEEVLIPLDWVIGGQQGIGRGWRMLVACLSAGRGISLPALSAGTAHLCTRMTTAYGQVRKQFSQPIAAFEGVQAALAEMIADTYTIEAARAMTAIAIDMKLSPAVTTAIAKYHMTEMARRCMNHALDIHAGKGIQMGSENYLARNYMGIPISITVEGANILTRNLMIFGQGATRCHPYILKEMQIVMQSDEELALKEFDHTLMEHLQFSALNAFAALGHALTGSRSVKVPVSGETRRYYQHLTRLSKMLAMCSDLAMLTLGGELKRKEMLSARLGDVLSQLYLASTVLKKFVDDGHQHSDLPMVRYALENSLHLGAKAISEFCDNFPSRVLGCALKFWLMPLGNQFRKPSDELAQQVCTAMASPNVARDRITYLCYLTADAGTGVMEQAFRRAHQLRSVIKQLNKYRRQHPELKGLSWPKLLGKAKTQQVIGEHEYLQLQELEVLRQRAIAVNAYETL